MKTIKKLDDSYRVLIPKEIRELFNLQKFQDLELSVDEDSHRIILTPIENDSNEDLSDQNNKNIPLEIVEGTLLYGESEIPIEPVTEETTIVDEPRQEKKFKFTDILEFFKPTKDFNLEDEIGLTFCSMCDRVVEPDSFMKVNGKKICKECIKDLRNQLIDDIKNK